ncbi:MAG: transporter substrate-binding domain-containing protein [Microcystaceae cyanobacterium]
MLKQIFLILIFSLSGVITTPKIAFGQTPPTPETEPDVPPKTLKVGVVGIPPFVINEDQQPIGMSVEIWQEVASRTQLQYELVPIPDINVNAGIVQVAQGELDVLIGPISITAERLRTVDFTQPYFQANIGLLVSSETPSVWSRIRPLFGIAIISSVGILFLALFIVGNCIWLAEHRRNEQFPKAYIPGVANGIWFSLVTLTTVGYGDKAPITKSGRTITGVWMLITTVAASSLTAGLASALTIFLSGDTSEKFTRPTEIADQRIAVIEGTTGEVWGNTYEARLVKATDLEQAVQKVLNNQAEAVLFDVPALEYYLIKNPEVALKIADVTFASENYGFALPSNSPLMNEINIAIIALDEEGKLDAIQEEVFDRINNQ